MESETRLLEKIRNYISKATLLNDDAIKNDTLIFELGLLDSMGLLFLIDFIKSEFNVDVNDAELTKENFESVNNISEFVYNKLNIP
ncbi:MAG TPA: acyl carrier protein [Paludibacter sp.]|nr:acyl carrier protein [Paludibacter sp.]